MAIGSFPSRLSSPIGSDLMTSFPTRLDTLPVEQGSWRELKGSCGQRLELTLKRARSRWTRKSSIALVNRTYRNRISYQHRNGDTNIVLADAHARCAAAVQGDRSCRGPQLAAVFCKMWPRSPLLAPPHSRQTKHERSISANSRRRSPIR